MLVRRSQRTRRSAIPNDYEVFLQEHDFDIRDDSDLVTYEKAINSSYSKFWLDVVEDEMKSMASNGVWDLVNLLDGSKPIVCKWSLRLKETLMIKWRGIRLDLLPKCLARKKELIIHRHFIPYPQRILLESLW